MSFDFSGCEIASSEAQQFVGAVAGALIVAAILIVLINIVLYVLKSLGLYTIAKRRGIACPWLAWLPVGCEWITASLADQYRKVTSGKATNRRFIIVVLAVISIGLTCFTTTTIGNRSEELTELAEYAEEYGADMDEEHALEFMTEVFEELSEILGGVTLVAALSSVIALASNVYWFVCAGDVYASCCPKNGTMMLVLSFFMPILAPFFFFCNKEKDAGMVPANKPQPQHVAPAEPTAPVYEAPVQQSVYEAPAQPIYEEPAQTPVEPWAASDTRPEPWENPEN